MGSLIDPITSDDVDGSSNSRDRAFGEIDEGEVLILIGIEGMKKKEYQHEASFHTKDLPSKNLVELMFERKVFCQWGLSSGLRETRCDFESFIMESERHTNDSDYVAQI